MCGYCNGSGFVFDSNYAFRCGNCNAAELKKISKSIPVYNGKKDLQSQKSEVKKEDYKQKIANPSDFKDDDDDDVLV